jgi:hypothetical protein
MPWSQYSHVFNGSSLVRAALMSKLGTRCHIFPKLSQLFGDANLLLDSQCTIGYFGPSNRLAWSQSCDRLREYGTGLEVMNVVTLNDLVPSSDHMTHDT